jgi:transcriptional regulator with XRE-family HTH domain
MVEPKPPGPTRDLWNSRVAARLGKIADGLTFRQIAARTRMNPETVRRYMRYGNPCIKFIYRFCQAFGTSADALLGLPGERRAFARTNAPARPRRAKPSRRVRRSARTTPPTGIEPDADTLATRERS